MSPSHRERVANGVLAQLYQYPIADRASVLAYALGVTLSHVSDEKAERTVWGLIITRTATVIKRALASAEPKP